MNPLQLGLLAILYLSGVALGVLAEREHRRRNRPGICPGCNEIPLKPGETECRGCCDRRQI